MPPRKPIKKPGKKGANVSLNRGGASKKPAAVKKAPGTRTVSRKKISTRPREETAAEPVKKPGMSLVGTLLLCIAWFLAIASGGTAFGIYQYHNRQVATLKSELFNTKQQIRNELQGEKRRLRSTLLDMKGKIHDQRGRHSTLIAAINREERVGKEIDRVISSGQSTISKLRENIDVVETQAQDLESQYQKVVDRKKALEEQRAKLLETYRLRYGEILTELKRHIADGDPKALQDYFHRIKHTPLGPVPAFYAAEHLYALKRSRTSEQALRLYNELMTRYPESLYAEKAAARIKRIEAFQQSDGKDFPGIIPYKPLAVVADIE